jgi:hypothetical protein
MVMSRDQNAGRKNTIKFGNKSSEGKEQFLKYLETILIIKTLFRKKLSAD